MGAQTACIQWEKRLGGSSFEFADGAMVPTSGGGMILAGLSRSGISGDKTQANWGLDDIWMVELDAQGNKLWDRRYGSAAMQYDMVRMARCTNGDLYVACTVFGSASGHVSEPTRGSTDYWIMRIDPTGVVLWDRRFGGAGSDEFESLIVTADGGFLLGGESESGATGDRTEPSWGMDDYWVVRGDAAGNKLWDRRFGGTDRDALRDMVQTPDGGFLLGGDSKSAINGDRTVPLQGGFGDFWAVRIDASGNKLWDVRFGSTYSANMRSMVGLPNGNTLLCGHVFGGGGSVTSSSMGEEDYWIVLIDPNGNKIWDKRYGGSATDFKPHAQVMGDGGFLISGYSESPASGHRTEALRGSWDLWLVRTDASGNILWNKVLGGTGREETGARPVYQNGWMHVFGITDSPVGYEITQEPRGLYDYWAVRLSDELLPTWYPDLDGDGLGWGPGAVQSCNRPADHVANGSDCDDTLVGGTVGTACNDNNPCTVDDAWVSGCICAGTSVSPAAITSSGTSSPVCVGGTITLAVSATGQGTISYAWTGPNGFTSTLQNPTIPGAANAMAGTYTVTISNGCGSSASANVTVSVINPSVSISYPPGAYCTLFQSTVPATITGPTNGVFSDNSTNLVVAPGSGALFPSISYPGDYVVTYTVAATTGCPQLQASTPVTIAPAPNADITYANGTNEICSVLQGPFLPDGGATPGGVFTGLFGTSGVDPATGELTFDQLTADTLTLWVNYEIPATSTCPMVDATVVVTVLPWSTYARDLDADGYGDPNDVIETCGPMPVGYAAQAGDYCPLDPLKISPGTCGCGQPEPGTACDDGDPLTHDDVITSGCTCAGTLTEQLCKQWSIVLGSNGSDQPQNVVPTADGGFLVTGRSNGGVGGDRSQDSRGSYDYWVAKVNAAGVKQWDKRFGGTSEEYQDGAVATADGGFLIGGFTFSTSGGDITQGTFGNTDFWVVRLDADGNALWNRRYGGSDLDKMTAVVATPDGGFLLGGYTWSSSSGDMNGINRGGMDYAVMKINASGVRQWTRMVGSSGQDYLYDVQLATDGSIYLIGESNGPVSGNKSQASFGGIDTWVVKLNASGTLLWDRTFGGSGADSPIYTRATITPDGGLLFVSRSTSGIGGNRTVPQLGFSDAWTVRVSSTGVKLWDRSVGAVSNIWLEDMVLAPGGGCYIGSREVLEEEVVDQGMNNAGLYGSYLLRTDFNGELLWDKGVAIEASLRSMLRTTNGLAILGEGTTGYPDATNSNGQTGDNYVLTYLTQGQDVQVWSDVDQDGHGGTQADTWQRRCGEMPGWSLLNDDCDDLNAAIFPGAPCDDGDPGTLNDQYDTNCTCVGSGTMLLLNVQVMLGGPYNGTTGLMSDALRVAGLVPPVEPYTQLGYSFVGGGGEVVQSGALSLVGVNAIVDWVIIELRPAQEPGAIIFSRSALVQRDGDVVGMDGGSPIALFAAPGNYHITVRHRNHLGIATAAPVALSGTLTTVDLTIASTAAYGTNARQNINGTMVLWPGDVNFDGVTRYTGGANDRDPVLLAIGGVTPTSVVNGVYSSCDINLDGTIRYTGANNDRDIILQTIGGSVPTALRVGQVP